MNTFTKTLLGSLTALLLCAGEGALFAADTAATGPQRSITVRYADLDLDRPTLSVYHERQTALAARRDPTIAQR